MRVERVGNPTPAIGGGSPLPAALLVVEQRSGGTLGRSAGARGAISHGDDLLSVRVEISEPRRQVPGCLRVALGNAR